jgi:hypothetical protein
MRKSTDLSAKATQTPPPLSGSESLGAAEDEIRVRAYELFLERNCEPDHAHDDWFRAESELRQRQPQGRP